MQQTPLNDGYNVDILNLMPKHSARIVEVGCGNGMLAKAYRESNENCDYIGIEITEEYAEMAKTFCQRAICGNIETMDDADFLELFPADCFIFGDCLEHLYDPWAVLRRIRKHMLGQNCIIASIPNAQHWSIQVALNLGLFVYKDHGLMDRTHIRWFTRLTMIDLFESTGYKIVEMFPRSFAKELPVTEKVLQNIAAMACSLGVDPEAAKRDALPVQWVIKAVPAD